MARIDVIMPQMGESIAEGTLSKWLKKVGDEVKRDEPIFEISTDKVDAEIPAPSAGVLAEIIVVEGQTVPVNAVVARLETEKSVAGSREPVAATPAAVSAQPVAGSREPVAGGGSRGVSTPAPPAPQASPSRGPAEAPAGGNGDSLEERLRTKSSPLVRRIEAEHGILPRPRPS